MVKGIDSVSSSGHSGSGYSGGLGSVPANRAAKGERLNQIHENLTASEPITRERIYNIVQALCSYSESARRGLKFHIEDSQQGMVLS